MLNLKLVRTRGQVKIYSIYNKFVYILLLPFHKSRILRVVLCDKSHLREDDSRHILLHGVLADSLTSYISDRTRKYRSWVVTYILLDKDSDTRPRKGVFAIILSASLMIRSKCKIKINAYFHFMPPHFDIFCCLCLW